MGLVRNLKKKLNDWGDKILVELCSAYIKQLAKQTTRKQDNSSPTTSLQSPLTTEPHATTMGTSSQGTTEKIIMEKTTEDVISHIRDWAVERVGEIHEEVAGKHHDDGRLDDAYAVYQEFAEWIEPEGEDIDLLCLDEG